MVIGILRREGRILMKSHQVLSIMYTFIFIPLYLGQTIEPDTTVIPTYIFANESNVFDCSNNLYINELNNSEWFDSKRMTDIDHYSDHSLLFDSQTGKDTQIVITISGISINHETENARSLNQNLELMADEGYYRSDYINEGSSTAHMSIREDITDGKVHVGAMQGKNNFINPLNEQPNMISTGWKNPELEIDEDYLGTFHIDKNMSIYRLYSIIPNSEPWLPCCMESYFDIYY